MQDGSAPAVPELLTEDFIQQVEEVAGGLRRLLYETISLQKTDLPSPTSSPPDHQETRSKPGSLTPPKAESSAYLQFTIDGQTRLSVREYALFKKLSEQLTLGLCSALVEHRFGPSVVTVESRSGEEVAFTRLRVSSMGVTRLPGPHIKASDFPAPSTPPQSSENGPGDPSSSTT